MDGDNASLDTCRGKAQDTEGGRGVVEDGGGGGSKDNHLPHSR